MLAFDGMTMKTAIKFVPSFVYILDLCMTALILIFHILFLFHFDCHVLQVIQHVQVGGQGCIAVPTLSSLCSQPLHIGGRGKYN